MLSHFLRAVNATPPAPSFEFDWVNSAFQDGLAQTSTAFTFSNVSIGVANSNRVVIVGIRLFNGSANLGTMGTVTIAGVTATQLVTDGGTGNSRTLIYAAAIPTGTTATILISTGNRTSCGIGVWRMVKAGASLATNATFSSASTSSFSINTITNGALVSVAGVTNGSPITWTGATERSELDIRTSEYTAWADIYPTTSSSASISLNQSVRVCTASFAP